MTFVDRLTVGRDLERTRIAGILDELAGGRGGLVWIDGAAGVGKSHLVADLAALATAHGCPVHIGYADQLMERIPLRTAADCLDVTSWSNDVRRASIARLLGGTLEGIADEVVYIDPVLAAAQRMLELVEDLCAEHPCVLVLEDTQWADDASLLLAERLSRMIDQIPLLLVVTSRPITARDDSPRLIIRAGASVRLGLQPLSAADVVALARAELGAPPGPRLSGELRTAAGNPLYVREILRALDREHLARLTDGRIDLSDTHPLGPASLAEVNERRLAVLSPAHIHALRVAAVMGNEFGSAELSLILGDKPDDIREMLTVALAADVVVAIGDRLRFQHELIRQSLLEQTPGTVVADLHDHIARTLASAGWPDGEIAGHLAVSGDPLRRWAIDWLVGRSDTALCAAPDIFAALLRRALAALTPEQPRWLPLAEHLLLVASWLGRDEDVIALGRETIAHIAVPDAAAPHRIRVMRSLSRLGRYQDGIDILAPGLGDPATSPVWHARMAAWSATAQAFMGNAERARIEGRAALTAAIAAYDLLGIAYAHSGLAVVSDPDQQIFHLDAGLAVLGDGPEYHDLRLILAGNRAARLGALGMLGAARAFEDVLVLAERVGTYRISTTYAHAAEYYFDNGEWDNTLLYIGQMDAAALRHPAFTYLHAYRAIIAYRRGRPQEGAGHLRAAGIPDEEPGEIGGPTEVALIDAVALRAESAGRLAEALRLRSRYLRLPVGSRRNSRAREAPFLIRLALAVGDREMAQAAADTCADTGGVVAGEVRLAVEICRAMMDTDADRLITLAAEAADGGWRLHCAFALEEAADLMARAGHTDGARIRFLEATNIYLEQDAAWDVRRAAARLRPYGIRRGARPEPRIARSGWEALTATEMRVARLVSDGHSNREVAEEMMLSRNTVQTHMSNILAKLGCRSRIELALEVGRRDPQQQSS